jgi:thiamine pyrophosphokinase
LLKVALDMGLRWLRKKLDSDTDAKEVSQVLRQALIGEIDSTEFPLLELLANQGIEIILSKTGQFADIMLGSRD